MRRKSTLPVSFPVMHLLLPVVSLDDASDLPIVLEGQSLPVMKAERYRSIHSIIVFTYAKLAQRLPDFSLPPMTVLSPHFASTFVAIPSDFLVDTC